MPLAGPTASGRGALGTASVISFSSSSSPNPSLLIDLQDQSGISVSDFAHLLLRSRPQQLCGLPLKHRAVETPKAGRERRSASQCIRLADGKRAWSEVGLWEGSQCLKQPSQ